MKRLLIPIAVVSAVLWAHDGAADSPSARLQYWPQWRGPLATGEAPEASPPVEWSETRNVRWKVQIPGRGQSTPIVWSDQVFVTTAVATDVTIDPEAVERASQDLPEWRREAGVAPERVLELVVLAIDRQSGEVRWRRTVRRAAPHEGTHLDGSWASSSPATDGEVLIAHFGSHGTYALDLDGKARWETDLGDMRTRNSFGEGSSPTIHGDRVVINWDHEGESFIVALDRRTGKTVWRVARDEVTSWSTPIVVTQGGRSQVIVNATGRTRGYDLDTGDLIWEAAGMTPNTIPSPVSAGGRVFVTSGFRGNALQAIDLAAAAGDVTDSPAVVWQHDQDTPYVPSPLLYRGRVYFLKQNQGILSCLDASDGRPHFSRQRLEGLTGVYASPVGADGRVYIAGRSGTTLVLQDGPQLRILARNALDEELDASPAIAGHELFLRGRESLYCIAEDETRAGGRGSRRPAAGRR